jgi:hypothetical protein
MTLTDRPAASFCAFFVLAVLKTQSEAKGNADGGGGDGFSIASRLAARPVGSVTCYAVPVPDSERMIGIDLGTTGYSVPVGIGTLF